MAAPNSVPANGELLTIIRRHTDGATVDQIAQEASGKPPRRVVQYALSLLEEHGQILNAGTSRAPRYKAAADQGAEAQGTGVSEQVTGGARQETGTPSQNTGNSQPPVAPASAPQPASRPTPRAQASPPPQPGPSAPGPSSAPAQRLGATGIGVDRGQVRDLVALIVGCRMQHFIIRSYIKSAARGLPNADEFAATVEAELAGLHPGNLAEFGLTPQQLEAWKARG